MKLLYGIQGTGNGHISRARAMAKALQNYPDIEITWLFSGRPKNQFFDMEIFGDYLWREGLTFVTKKGQIRNLETLAKISPRRFIQDIRSLALDQYDLIATDYEPVTAWAARLKKRQVIGIGHQYAFNYDIPTAGENVFTKQLLKWFAPAHLSLGLHWDNFGHAILPPIAEVHSDDNPPITNKVIIYLPFEDNQSVIDMLKPIKDYQFYVYSPGLLHQDLEHIHTRPPSRDGFQRDLASSSSVVSNCGFELISEAVTLGKRILTKPVKGQMEQQSNGAALELLNMATVTQSINTPIISDWLSKPEQAKTIAYPDVAAAICEWLLDTNRCEPKLLAQKLWAETKVN